VLRAPRRASGSESRPSVDEVICSCQKAWYSPIQDGNMTPTSSRKSGQGTPAAVPRSVKRRASRAARSQLELPLSSGWGGARRNAGRKPGPRPNTAHRARPRQRAAEPVHVTLRARIASLRTALVFPSVQLALVRAARRAPDRFRIIHFSVQRDHVHLVVEAESKRALSSGVRGVAIRIARYVNDLLSRRGPLWADRWYGRALTSPREVRDAIVYVLANFRKHARRASRAGIDPYSSSAWFDGFREWRVESGVPPPLAEPARGVLSEAGRVEDAPVTCADFAPRTWLATVGWRRLGLVGIAEAPRADARAPKQRGAASPVDGTKREPIAPHHALSSHRARRPT
jgi:REP element-mobilizing transposase RayT